MQSMMPEIVIAVEKDMGQPACRALDCLKKDPRRDLFDLFCQLISSSPVDFLMYDVGGGRYLSLQ